MLRPRSGHKTEVNILMSLRGFVKNNKKKKRRSEKDKEKKRIYIYTQKY
jgi:hypothetical protein